MSKISICHDSVIEKHYCDDMSDCQYGQPDASAGYEKECLCFFRPGKTMEERMEATSAEKVSKGNWDMIEKIRSNTYDYEEFRLRTKRFMQANSMSIHALSVETSLSRVILTSFLRDGYGKLSFRTISKLINFMDGYNG